MKTIKFLIAAACLLPALAFAELTIAVVDPIAAIGEANEVKQRTAAMEVEVREQEGRLRELRDAIVEIEERLQREEMTLSRDQKRDLESQRDGKMFEFRSLQQSVQQSVTEDQQELLELMRPKFELAVSTVASEKGIDLVLNNQAAIFANSDLDITREVTQKINAMSE